MGFLEFIGGVWVALVLLVFIIAMVVGCTYDRRHREGPKWYIFGIGLLVLVVWQYKKLGDPSPIWRLFDPLFDPTIWKGVGIYLAIGLVYCIIEFALEVRRSAAYWRETWSSFKVNYKKSRNQANEARIRYMSDFGIKQKEPEPVELDSLTVNADAAERAYGAEFLDAAAKKTKTWIGDNRPARGTKPEEAPDIVLSAEDEQKAMVHAFIGKWSQERSDVGQYNIIRAAKTEDATGIEPRVDKLALSGCIGVWTMFWPFYAISLVFGQLLSEVFDMLASILASISGRFVKLAFKDVFKF